MKKILISILAFLTVVPAFAQSASSIDAILPEEIGYGDEEDRTVIFRSPDDKVLVYGSSHIGYGFHSLKSSDFLPGRSKEIFINMVKLGVYPADFLGLELSMDLEHNSFKSNNTFFFIDENSLVRQLETGMVVTGKVNKPISAFNYFTLNFPLLAKVRLGKMELGGGAEAGFNFAGRTWYRYSFDNRTIGVRDKGAKLNTFTYGFVGVLSYDGIAFFVKWYPKTSRILPEGSLDLNYMTLGLAFGL